jgi:hypothetical protein
VEEIDWLAEIGGQRPTEARLWEAWKRVIRRVYDGQEKEITRQVRIWEGNLVRRSSHRRPVQTRGHGGVWCSSWPGWLDIVGPYPDEPPLRDTLYATWQAMHPDAKPVRASTGSGQRFNVLARDGFRCRYCGRAAPDVVLHVDHIYPKSKGGSDDPSNLGAACADCNTGKRDKVLP